jgi:hypothetical protein
MSPAGHGGQVRRRDSRPGQRRLKDLEQRQRLYRLVIEGLPSEFKLLRMLDVEPKRKRRRTYAGSALVGAAVAAVAIRVLVLGHGRFGLNPVA